MDTTKSLKLNAALHFRLNDKVEAIIQGNYGYGTSIYTGSDRYSIKNFTLWQGKAELKSSDFYLRAYTTQENSGDSYANSILASGINEAWKKSEDWYADYFGGIAGAYGPLALGAIQAGLPTGIAGITTELAKLNIANYFAAGRGNADVGRLIPGTAAFEAVANTVKDTPLPGKLLVANYKRQFLPYCYQ